MRINEAKSNYMIFIRCKTDFVTRLQLNNTTLDQIKVTKLLGVWISEDLSWEKNTVEICKKAYLGLSVLTKLKYVGVKVEDLIEIYILFIRSCTEYCAAAFHSSLTLEQSYKLERIQKVCMKVILGDMYLDYESPMEMCGLTPLHERRRQRCLSFALKCLKHPRNSRLFPLNPNLDKNKADIRERELFKVHFANTDTYKDATIPYCQRLLNQHFS